MNVRVAWFYGGGCTPAGSDAAVTPRWRRCTGHIFRGIPLKELTWRAPRAILTAAGAKLSLPPSGVPPTGPFRPGAEPVVDRYRPHRTLARVAVIGKVT